jgi:hypothetical protein
MLSYSHFAISQPSQYESFGFQKFEATVLSPYQMIHINQENAQFVKSYIQKELEAHGLRLSSSPDLYVNVNVILKLQQQDLGQDDSQLRSRPISTYQVGTLNVQLVDVIRANVLWEGSRSIVLWGKKEKKIRKRVDNIVAKLFKDFDPSILGN